MLRFWEYLIILVLYWKFIQSRLSSEKINVILYDTYLFNNPQINVMINLWNTLTFILKETPVSTTASRDWCETQQALFVWIRVHGDKENETDDTMDILLLKRYTVDLNVLFSRTEGNSIIMSWMSDKWQQHWDINDTGRHLYNIKVKVVLAQSFLPKKYRIDGNNIINFLVYHFSLVCGDNAPLKSATNQI